MDIAKRRIREEYFYVGIFEDMTRSLALLQRLLPGFFGDRAAWDIPHENRGDRVGDDVDAETLGVLRRANALDMELYDYAKRLHDERAAACL